MASAGIRIRTEIEVNRGEGYVFETSCIKLDPSPADWSGGPCRGEWTSFSGRFYAVFVRLIASKNRVFRRGKLSEARKIQENRNFFEIFSCS